MPLDVVLGHAGRFLGCGTLRLLRTLVNHPGISGRLHGKKRGGPSPHYCFMRTTCSQLGGYVLRRTLQTSVLPGG